MFKKGERVLLKDFSSDKEASITWLPFFRDYVGKEAVVKYDGTSPAPWVQITDEIGYYWEATALESLEEKIPVRTKEERKNELVEYLEENHVFVACTGFVEWLDDMGFFTAPASTKYHGAYEGGLYDHSIAVTKKLVEMTEQMHLSWMRSASPYIVGILHDICKCDAYIIKDDGTYDYNKEQILAGHGDKSALIATNRWGRITEEEMLCIRYHMGAYESPDMWKNYGAAIGKYENILWTHAADMYAAKVLRT